jgi:SAM-dependent methyltransferase
MLTLLTMLKPAIKSFVDRYPLVKSIGFAVDDLKWGINLARGNFASDSGTIHSTFTPDDSVSYIEEVFNDYKQYAGIDRFYGVGCEIGPGDNAGVAILMRLEGCQHVDLIDRYLSHRDAGQQAKIYQKLDDLHSIASLRESPDWDERGFTGVNWQIGQAAEVYFQNYARQSDRKYDFILSRAVFEHLYDPLFTIEQMVTCLNPGGKLAHKIDFRDHGMFTATQPELTFLEIPSSLYHLMVKNSGRPNRVLIHRYREILEPLKNAGLIDYTLLVTSMVDVGEISPHQQLADIAPAQKNRAVAFVEAHRHKFAEEFAGVSSEDLAVSGIFAIVTKK